MSQEKLNTAVPVHAPSTAEGTSTGETGTGGTGAGANAHPYFSVNLEKMTAGIGTIFTGVMQLLAALEQIAPGNSTEKADGGSGTAKEKGEDYAEETDVGSVYSAAYDRPDDRADTCADGEVETVVKEPAEIISAETKERSEESTDGPDNPDDPEAPAPKETALKIDDLVRVASQKIKDNSANKAKILEILQSYGAEHITKLPKAQYEAFLTELASL